MGAKALVRERYSGAFLTVLLLASFLPAVVSLLHFEVTNGTAYVLIETFSSLAFLGSAHIWLTLAYYTDRRWLAHFNKAPTIFYVAPLVIALVVVALCAQPYKPVGIGTFYVLTFANLWHHSRQNWGILTLVSNIRHETVAALRKPIVYAWLFFLIPWTMNLPEINGFIGHDTIYAVSLGCVALFLAYYAYHAICGGFFAQRDPVVIVFGAVLCVYFVPLIAFDQKPYAILIWAGAHALQYYLLVWVSLSLHERTTLKLTKGAAVGIFSLLVLVMLTFISYATSQGVGTGDLWSALPTRLVFGVVLSMNLIHYWVDACIWKFSNKTIVNLHGEAFAFP